MEFNQSQREAIEHNLGPCLVLAGPGSGKTAVLTHRVWHLISKRGVRPSDILVITFTRAAAEQMRNRFMTISENSGNAVTFGTFHSVFFTILKNAYNYSARNVITPAAQRDFIQGKMCSLELEYDDNDEAVNDVLSEISKVKNSRADIDSYEAVSVPTQSFRIIMRDYEQMLVKRRLLDFDDMIVQCLRLLSKREDYRRAWQERFKYILVDEFQDINSAQFEVVKLLAGRNNNLFVVGDDDQSIYGFRGATPEVMLGLGDSYRDLRRINLTVNYRSTGNIVLAARTVIEENTDRYAKDIQAAGKIGEPVEVYEFRRLDDEKSFLADKVAQLVSDGVSYDDIAVLSRTNIVGGMYKARLMVEGIPCVSDTVQEDMYDHWVAQDILAYIKISLGSCERKDYLRIINKPMRYITRALLGNPVDMSALRQHYLTDAAMCARIDRLAQDLALIKNMPPFAAVNYIRKGIGYDSYISDCIYEHKMNSEEIYSILDELMHAASGFGSLQKWLESIGERKKESEEEDRSGKTSKSGVHFHTMHCAKGLEYRIVFVTDVCEGVVPYNKAVFDAQIEEERRLFYVAMTRAKEKLYLMYPRRRYNKDTVKSRFIDEMQATRYPNLKITALKS